LLLPAAVSGNGSRKKSVAESLGGSPKHIQFRLIGYVIMPEHVHLLISERKKSNVSGVLQVLKQRVSRAMRGKKRRISRSQLSLKFGDSMMEDRRFWQRRFYDFNVWVMQRGKKSCITCIRIL